MVPTLIAYAAASQDDRRSEMMVGAMVGWGLLPFAMAGAERGFDRSWRLGGAFIGWAVTLLPTAFLGLQGYMAMTGGFGGEPNPPVAVISFTGAVLGAVLGTLLGIEVSRAVDSPPKVQATLLPMSGGVQAVVGGRF
ncbi:MAG: hypothetical protein AB1938_32370 [Myxococcota bacterium]